MPADVVAPFASYEKLSADFAEKQAAIVAATFAPIAQQVAIVAEKPAATVAAISAQVAPFTEAMEKLSANIAKQVAPFTEAMEKLSANIAKQVARYVAKMAPRRQPHRSHGRSSSRTSARRTRSGAARALSRQPDEPARLAPGRDAGLALFRAVVGGLDTLPACWRVIA